MSDSAIPTSLDLGDGDLQSPLISRKLSARGESKTGIEKLCVDDMLHKYCGGFGWWQLKHFVLSSMAWTLGAFHAMVIIFSDRQPDWRCSPGSSSSPCISASASGSVCGLDPGSWEWIDGPGTSTVSEWGLFCRHKYKVGLVQSLFFAGSMIGAGVFGHLSDSKLGRKGSLSVVCLLNAIFGCLTAVSPNVWIYAFLRFLTSFSSGGVGLCAFVLATEPVSPTMRGIAGMSTFYFFSAGIAILSGIAYTFKAWRVLYVASSIPSFLFLVLIIPFVSESPRWYLVRGEVNHAMKIMHEIAETNGKSIPDNVVIALDEEVKNSSIYGTDKVEAKDAVTGSVIDVLKSPLTRVRLILAVGVTFLCSVVYYGISLNVVNLNTNLYVAVLINALVEMPAYLLTAVLLDRIGRKPLGIGTQWFSGVFCMIGSLWGGRGIRNAFRMVCGAMGIVGMAGTYNLLFIYTSELFPTVVRNAALGCATQASQMGAILAPFVVVMGSRLPFLVFGVCGMVGGILICYLPETLNRPLYDTMAGMEDGETASGFA